MSTAMRSATGCMAPAAPATSASVTVPRRRPPRHRPQHETRISASKWGCPARSATTVAASGSAASARRTRAQFAITAWKSMIAVSTTAIAALVSSATLAAVCFLNAARTATAVHAESARTISYVQMATLDPAALPVWFAEPKTSARSRRSVASRYRMGQEIPSAQAGSAAMAPAMSGSHACVAQTNRVRPASDVTRIAVRACSTAVREMQRDRAAGVARAATITPVLAADCALTTTGGVPRASVSGVSMASARTVISSAAIASAAMVGGASSIAIPEGLKSVASKATVAGRFAEPTGAVLCHRIRTSSADRAWSVRKIRTARSAAAWWRMAPSIPPADVLTMPHSAAEGRVPVFPAADARQTMIAEIASAATREPASAIATVRAHPDRAAMDARSVTVCRAFAKTTAISAANAGTAMGEFAETITGTVVIASSASVGLAFSTATTKRVQLIVAKTPVLVGFPCVRRGSALTRQIRARAPRHARSVSQRQPEVRSTAD